MYAIYAYIHLSNHSNVGKYDIHGVSGTGGPELFMLHGEQMCTFGLKIQCFDWPSRLVAVP